MVQEDPKADNVYKHKPTWLDRLVAEVSSTDITQQIREMCDIIMKEETPRMPNIDKAPKGPNKFLTIEIKGFLKNEIGFLTLEREAEQEYVGVFWSLRLKKGNYRTVKVHTIEGNTAKKIMHKFAKLVNFYRYEKGVSV